MFAFSQNARLVRIRAPFAPLLLVTVFALASSSLSAQGAHALPGDSGAGPSLDALIAMARVASPTVRAAQARVAAADARLGPAGAWPDPMLMAGIVNLPIGAEPATAPPEHGGAASNGLPDAMTMKMIGVSQTIMYPGKLGLQRLAASHDETAATAALDAARLTAVRNVADAWYELAYLDHALDVAIQTSAVLAGLINASSAQYSAGTSSGSQQDVLEARVEATRVAELANMLRERRRATLAELNAVLGRPSDAPVAPPTVPDRIQRAAITADSDVRFAGHALGAPAAGSPLPSIAELQTLAMQHSPVLRQRRATTAAQAARVQLAHRAYKPDVDVTLEYGQRTGWPDMVTAEVSIPLHVHRAQREDQRLAEASAELVAAQADGDAEANAVRAQVASLASDLEQRRTDVALYATAILPQSRGAATAALVSYQSGRAGLRVVLDAENSVFTYETAYYRALTDFAKGIAALDQVVGAEVLP